MNYRCRNLETLFSSSLASFAKCDTVDTEDAFFNYDNCRVIRLGAVVWLPNMSLIGDRIDAYTRNNKFTGIDLWDWEPFPRSVRVLIKKEDVRT